MNTKEITAASLVLFIRYGAGTETAGVCSSLFELMWAYAASIDVGSTLRIRPMNALLGHPSRWQRQERAYEREDAVSDDRRLRTSSSSSLMHPVSEA
ncbi:hypothetical protein EYF80_047537 [Liparis tanakae]|uniref:Uncharacterized protein n=1 Tax=Liparis tanakae TaxID=230148 RepID=A0A4Z2FMB7_9TELE|nr:hypothetical protein EYF80_047537 [Liparis tanakae]